MSERYLLTNANIVAPDRVLDGGTVVVEDGLIAEVSPRSYPPAAGDIDLGGRLLMPGIVDLHNDALEKEIAPRPRAAFDPAFALLHLDRKLAAAGLTTEFHAVYFANRNGSGRSVEFAGVLAEAINNLRAAPHPTIDNQVLHRIDVRSPAALDPLLRALDTAAVPCVSLNDHVPGQGQFNDLEAYRAYTRSFLASNATEAEVDAVVAERVRHAAETEEEALAMTYRLAEEARRRGLILSSHDDDTPERVDLMHELGCTIAEFPITLAAARRAAEHGMLIAMGAPNALQGRSLSGNASALDLLARGLVDILVADYHASSMLAATFQIVAQGLADLPAATRLISDTPARAVGLTDRGAIVTGRRADLIVVEQHGGLPIVAATLLHGTATYAGGPFAAALASARQEPSAAPAD
jgi:alpha-D-ribose 1-methylphosphonate 5-triphosphate diphosphatase